MSRSSPVLRLATTLLVCTVLSGCAGSPPGPSPLTSPSSSVAGTPSSSPASPSASSVADLQAAIARSDAGKRYSATMKVRTLLGGRLAVVMTGRVNFNAVLTGYVKVRVLALGGEKAQSFDEILTRRATYVRSRTLSGGGVTGRWQRVPGSSRSASTALPSPGSYANLLLEKGPSAVKGQEAVGGKMATRLSGRIETEQVRTIEPSLYDRLRTASVDDFGCDIWVDAKGRVLRLDQWIVMQGNRVHNIMTISKFRGPLAVSPPAV